VETNNFNELGSASFQNRLCEENFINVSDSLCLVKHFFCFCHLRIKSAPFLMDLKFKSALLIFVFFLNHIKKVVVGFVEMWESRRLFQVIVGSVGKS